MEVKMKNTSLIVILLLLCVLIAVFPLLIIKDSEFGGADGEAEDAISEVNPGYESWMDPLMEPPGGETESLLFSLQAGLGALVVGYGFGYYRARKKFTEES